MAEDFENFCFYGLDGVEVGVVAPSTFYTMDDGRTVINGPSGVVKLNEQSLSALTEGLQRAGSLVTGTPAEVTYIVIVLQTSFLAKTTTMSSTMTDSKLLGKGFLTPLCRASAH